MSISNGQLANAENLNNAFPSKQLDNDLSGKLKLSNNPAVSGPVILNVQKEINDINEDIIEIGESLNDHEGRLDVHDGQTTLVGIFDPTVNDDSSQGIIVGAIWHNKDQNSTFILEDGTAGAAVWRRLRDKYTLSGPLSGTDGSVMVWDASLSRYVKCTTVIINPSSVMTGLQGLVSSGVITSSDTLYTMGRKIEDHQDAVITGVTNAQIENPSKSVIRIVTPVTSIECINNNVPGRELTIINLSGASINFFDNTGAVTYGRILTGKKGTLALADQATIHLKYDGEGSRWMVIGGSGSASGGSSGGGGTLKWEKLGDNSPSNESEDGIVLEGFSDTENQEIYVTVNVPMSYVPGTQIKLIGGAFFIATTTGNIQFQASTNLIRPGVTTLGFYGAPYLSTNPMKTPTTLNLLTELGDVDLTNAVGVINSIAVQPGNKLRIKLFRDPPQEATSAPGLAKLLINNLELKFS